MIAAEEEGFDLFITADQELAYQQNMNARRMAVMVLSTNNWTVIKERIAEIAAAIEKVPSGGFLFVDIGHGRGM